MTNRSVLERAH